MTTGQREYLILTLLLAILLGFTIPSLLTARASVRDGLRRQDITYLKRSLEQFYNANEYYPLINGADCITSDNPSNWYFIDTLPHDVREDDGHIYRYCVTDTDPAAGGAIGYFLEATLEVDQPTGNFFDEDESRKFYYRQFTENDRTIYRVCGGTEMQCEK